MAQPEAFFFSSDYLSTSREPKFWFHLIILFLCNDMLD